MRLQDTYDLLLKFESCRTEDDVQKVTLGAAGQFGVTHYFSGIMPPKNALPNEQLDHVIGGFWPDKWANRYFHRRYLDLDPTIEHVRNSTAPLIWGGMTGLSKNSKRVMNEAGEIGLKQGITIPQSSLDGFKIGISFASDRIDFQSPLSTAALTVIGSYAVATSMRCTHLVSKPEKVTLTYREREVLYWLAEGKTSVEVGDIMSIATPTVEKHFRSVLSKLGAQNRVHAVAEAMRRGIIN